ncbi:Protein of unknown function [Cotesia congregata]|uniref:Uncharacterized protein n=1 Tax=Cotesia congregata TaxID=51543 RepID=A0A8J2EC01_COTCN|nr:Protein of unknown function [Cotesia congregata]
MINNKNNLHVNEVVNLIKLVKHHQKVQSEIAFVSCYTKNTNYKSVIAPYFDYFSSLILNFSENKLKIQTHF